MKGKVLFASLLLAAMVPHAGHSQTADAPEIDACRASGLIALKERSPSIKDVNLDLDSVRVVRVNSKIESIDVKAILLADAYVERQRTGKPQNLICIVGDKGKVLLTVFTNH